MNDRIKEIEVTIEEAESTVATKEALERLCDNKDFQELIINGYFRDHVASLVRYMSTPIVTNSKEKKEQVLADISGVAVLHNYFNSVIQKGNMAEQTIASHKAELTHIRTN